MQPNVVQPSLNNQPGESIDPHIGLPVSHPPMPEFAMPPPSPPQMQASSSLTPSGSDQPVAVVQALSVRGVEYTMMSLALWFSAGALLWALLSLVNGGTSFDLMALPASILIVAVPIFGILFLRLRREELANPDLRLDPSKRRLSQFTQIFTFAVCLFNLIAFVYEVMLKIGGRSSASIGKVAINLLIVFVVAGGIFAYYWVDEHRLIRNK